jgi:L-rhamnose mutarotase
VSGSATVGKWTAEESALFEKGLVEYGKDWKRIQKMVPTRTLTQIRTHAQKRFKKMARLEQLAREPDDGLLPLPSTEDVEISVGKWRPEEQQAFKDGLKAYGRNFKRISRLIPTRTPVQVRTHAQKYFRNLEGELPYGIKKGKQTAGNAPKAKAGRGGASDDGSGADFAMPMGGGGPTMLGAEGAASDSLEHQMGAYMGQGAQLGAYSFDLGESDTGLAMHGPCIDYDSDDDQLYDCLQLQLDQGLQSTPATAIADGDAGSARTGSSSIASETWAAKANSPPADAELGPSSSWSMKLFQFTGGGGYTMGGRKRICFQVQLSASCLAQYVELHQAIWPEMQQTLHSCGWHNYSLFYRPDGLVVGYYETDSDCHETACQRRARNEIDRQWQEAIRTFTVGNAVQYDSMLSLEHYFYLGDDRVMCPAPGDAGDGATAAAAAAAAAAASASAAAHEHAGGGAEPAAFGGDMGGGAGLAAGAGGAAGGGPSMMSSMMASMSGGGGAIGGGGSVSAGVSGFGSSGGDAGGGGGAVGTPSSGGGASPTGGTGGSSGVKPQEYTGGGQLTRNGRKRICFTMKVAPEAMPAYIQMHKVIWPEMQETLVSCGWHNYSLFYRKDGQIFGYYETDNANHEESCRKRRESEVDRKWQEAIRRFTPDNVMQYDTYGTLEHCFYLGQDRLPA